MFSFFFAQLRVGVLDKSFRNLCSNRQLFLIAWSFDQWFFSLHLHLSLPCMLLLKDTWFLDHLLLFLRILIHFIFWFLVFNNFWVQYFRFRNMRTFWFYLWFVNFWCKFLFFLTKNIILFFYFFHLINWLEIIDFNWEFFHDFWRHGHFRSLFKSFFIKFDDKSLDIWSYNFIIVNFHIFEPFLFWLSYEMTKFDLNVFGDMIELLKRKEDVFDSGVSMSYYIELFIINNHFYPFVEAYFINKFTCI